MIDAKKETFEVVTVLGHVGLFTCCRVDIDTVPDGLYVYDVRHDDDCQGLPVEIANKIFVNHWGTLIMKEELPLRKSGITFNAYLPIDPEKDWNYEGSLMTLGAYILDSNK